MDNITVKFQYHQESDKTWGYEAITSQGRTISKQSGYSTLELAREVCTNTVASLIGFVNKFAQEERDKAIYDLTYRWASNADFSNIKYDKYRSDREVCLTAIGGNPKAIKYVSEELLNDNDFLIDAWGYDGYAFEYFPAHQKHNIDVITAGLSKSSTDREYIFEKLPEEIRYNKEIYLKLSNDNHWHDWLQYAPDELKDDYDFAIKIVTNIFTNMNYVSKRLKANYDFMFEAVTSCSYNLRHAAEELQNDDSIVLQSIEAGLYASAFKDCGQRHRHNPKYTKWAVSIDGTCLRHTSKINKDNPEIVLLAYKQDQSSLQYASRRIRSLCKQSDPLKVLETLIAKNELENQLSIKEDPNPKKVFKI